MSLLRRACASLILVACGGLIASACVKNESSIFVEGCLVQTLDTCEATADPGAARRSGGLLDAAFGVEYVCPLLVGNQLVARGDSTRLRTETSRIQIYAADVTLLDAGGNLLTRSDGTVASYTVPTSGEADPGTATQPGFGIADVVMLDASTASDLGGAACGSALQQEIVANVIIRARTLGGDELESAPFNYPINVCFGCTCSQPIDDSCTTPTAAPDANCRIGEDSPTDCRFLGADCADFVATCAP